MGCAEKQEGTGTNSFLSNSSAVSSTNPFCPLGRLQNQNQKHTKDDHPFSDYLTLEQTNPFWPNKEN